MLTPQQYDEELSFSGWGDTGDQETSTDKLQETVLPIVETSICIERINETESVDENLIVCAGGASKGPCKVRHQTKISFHLLHYASPQGRQWWATYSREGRGPCPCWDRKQNAWRWMEPDYLRSAELFHFHQRLGSPALD